MTRDWKAEPGCVAAITLGNGHQHPVAFWRLHDGWQTPANTVHPAHVADARPLVVIDPEDLAQVDRFDECYWRTVDDDGNANMQAALREFANSTPPKPDEPQGLGAVVEDEDGSRLIRNAPHSDRPWVTTHGIRFAWSEIDPARVISEGWDGGDR